MIATPGPDTALTLRNTLLGGRPAGVASALGIGSGQLCWALAASGGVAALLLASQPLFLAVKLAGAAYLVFLGMMALRASRRHARARSGEIAAVAKRRLGARDAYLQGLLSDLANPKMAAFFTSLFPQFAPAHGAPFLSLLPLGLIFSVLTIAWLALYATLADRLGGLLRRSRVRSAIEAATGFVLIALGIRIAAERGLR